MKLTDINRVGRKEIFMCLLSALIGTEIGMCFPALHISEYYDPGTVTGSSAVVTESVLATDTTTDTDATTTTTESTTETPTITTATSTTKITTAKTTTVTTAATDESSLTLVGTFKGTYYAGKTVPCKGGSGRTLIDCTAGKDGLKGSVASKYIYQKYGYKVSGRTKVYLELPSYPKMSGWYAVDDCNADSRIVDFYFHYNKNCPWRVAGVTEVKMYV